MSDRDELLSKLRSWNHCWPAPWLERAVAAAADQIERDGREIERLRKAAEYDADAAKGMAAEVDLGDGAVATIIDPRSFTYGGPEWVMRYGSPASIRFVAASLLESYDGLLSDHITTREAVRRLRLMRNARALLLATLRAYRSTREGG